jgi:hypothetical protein
MLHTIFKIWASASFSSPEVRPIVRPVQIRHVGPHKYIGQVFTSGVQLHYSSFSQSLVISVKFCRPVSGCNRYLMQCQCRSEKELAMYQWLDQSCEKMWSSTRNSEMRHKNVRTPQKNFKYSSKYGRYFCPTIGNTVVISVRYQLRLSFLPCTFP